MGMGSSGCHHDLLLAHRQTAEAEFDRYGLQ
jgi:hypothetical protein